MSVPPPRPVKDRPESGPVGPGGLYVGAVGTDGSGLSYRLVAPLDRGGMGELFVAEMIGPAGTPRYAVVKRLLPDLMNDTEYVEMFRAEAEIMARLDHPSVVRVFGVPELEGTPCLALEFVDGRSVQQLISRARRLGTVVPPGVAAYVGARVASALDHVHHARDSDGIPLDLVHRDVSPGNVLLGFDGSVKLTDFGIAKTRLSTVQTTVGIVKGKARYLSPEQVLGRPATPRSDLFSAAVLVVELLTGRPLFERGSIPKTLYAIVHGQRPTLTELLPPPAHPLAEVLEAALAPDPTLRLPTAQALAHALESLDGRIGPPVDREALGQYLRGLFAGTEGPLTEAGKALPWSRPGATPLDPDAFPGGPSSPLPLLDPIEAPPGPRSAPHEVDDALSVLAWLQSRAGGPAPTEDDHTVVGPPPEPPRKQRGLGFLLGLAVGAAVGALASLGAVATVGSPLAERAEAPAKDASSPRSTGGRSEGRAATDRRSSGGGQRSLAVASPMPEAEEAARSHEDAPGAVDRAPSERAVEPEPAPRGPAPATLAPANTGAANTDPANTDPAAPAPVQNPSPPDDPAPPEPARPAALDVQWPRRAEIWVDGERLGSRAPLRGQPIEPGTRVITVGRGRLERIFELRVAPGERIIIGRDLRRKDP